MSYLSLYRKWRPQKFAEVVGQEVVVKILQNAVKMNRISHAYLFAGPRGVGKTSVARILAKALNCEKGPAEEPCNECSSCRKITDGSSFDVLEIDGASNRGVDEVRGLKERVNLAPVEGRYKVYIVDEVHMLTLEAFNALLKTLEEPPPRVIFILATTEPHKLPLTIRSRCLFLAFRPIDPKYMVKRLEEILEKENIEILQDVLWEIARRADGSLRDAISLLEQLLAFGGEITLESLERNFGILSRSEVMEKIPLFREGKWEEVFLWINSLKERGVMVPYLFEDLGEIFRRIWVFKLSSRADEIFGLSASEREFYHTESKHWDEDVLWSILNIVERRGDRIRMGSSPFRELEMFFWELKKKMSSELLSLEKRDFPTDEARSDEGKVKREVLKTEVTAKDVGTQKNDLEKLEEFLSKLKERKISLYTFMLEADRSIRDGKLRIEYPSELRFHYEQIRRPENMAILKDVLKEVFGKDMEIEVTLTVPDREEQKVDSEEEKGESSKDILEHPTFQTILKLFGGDIVEIEREIGEEDEES